ncbi:hypothetical protein ACFFUE_07045 [Bergeyella porcorum]|uniref:hypothetical protein n=1 Tax=Bergeyella porcorum TaxID=1735111 RepID=UPI0035E82363
MDKFLALCFIIVSITAFSQVKKERTVKQDYVDYDEYITDFKNNSSVKKHLMIFPIGKEFEKNTISTDAPKVEYIEKAGLYRYIYKTEEANFIIYVKNGLIISKKIILYDIDELMYLVNFFDLYNKEFIKPKGFKLNDTQYLLISKSRHYDYDSYEFNFRGLEYFNILDLLESKENEQK